MVTVVAEAVKVDTVKLDKNYIEIDKTTDGNTTVLKATISPSNATLGKDLIWESSNTDVADVDQDGNVTLKNNGKAIISVKSSLSTPLNTIGAKCEIHVHTSPESIKLDKSELVIDLSGETNSENLTVIYTPTDTDTNKNISWASSSSNVAQVSEQVSGGRVTAIENGTTTIKATTINGKEATCKVTVQTTPKSIRLTQDNNIIDLSSDNVTSRLIATLEPEGKVSTSNNITWTSSDENIATVDNNGVVTGKSNGKVTITASTENMKEAKCEFIVQTSPKSVKLNSEEEFIDISKSSAKVKLEATLEPSTVNANNTLTWTSSDESVAIVDENGNVTGRGNGTATITVTTANGKTATCRIICGTSIISINLIPENLNMLVNEEQTITAQIDPTSASESIRWNCSNTNVEIIGYEGDKNSTVKIKAKSGGTSYITAESESGEVNATASVTVNVDVTSISLNKDKLTFDLGKGKIEEKLEATILPADANVSTGITWTSSNPDVAKVDENGKVTALANGTAVITATTENNKTASCEVLVQTSIISMRLDRTSVTLDVGVEERTTQQLNVIFNPSTANVGTRITWSSSNENIAMVNGEGLVIGQNNGKAKVTATSEDGHSAECEVTVQTSPMEVTLDKENATLDLSGTKTVQLVATINPETSNVNNGLTWTSSDSSIATVSSDGLVTAVKNGTAIITVRTQNGKTATCTITVQTSPLGVTLDKESATLDLTGTKTVQLTATVTPNTINVSTGLTWTSSDSGVATVSDDGLVTGLKNGTATITVTTTNGKTATCTITVQTSPLGVTLDKTSATIDLSLSTKTVQLTPTISPNTANANTGLTWTSSDSNVAAVDGSGLVTGKANGTAKITVTTANGKKAECNITVQTSPLGVTLNKTSATLDLSGTKTVQLTATINPNTANVSNGLTWSSSNTSVATVSDDGLVTGIKNGSTTITVTTTNGKTKSCNVVVQTSITGLTVNPTSAEIQPGQTVQLTATKTPTSTTEGVTWRSNNESVATVNSSGLVTGAGNGTTTIVVQNSTGTISAQATIRCYQKYTITYNANNGSGAPGNQTKTHGTDITLSSTQPTRTGYTFKGWNTRADGTGTTYAAGASYRNNANLTLYAMWEVDIGVYVALNGSTLNFYNNEVDARAYADSDAHYYGNIINESFSDYSQIPWYSDRATITQVNIAQKIQPKITAYWFSKLTKLTGISNISNLDTSNVTNMSNMFNSCFVLASLDVSRFDTSNVTDVSSMFSGCYVVTSLDVSGFDTSNVANMRAMFSSCNTLTSLDVSGFDTSKVTNMSYMFNSCDTLTSLDVSGFDTSNVTDMSYMFSDCKVLTSLDVSKFNTSKVTSMSNMFNSCQSLTSLDVSGFDTSNVTSMFRLFNGCNKLTSLDLSGFDTNNVKSMGLMFNACIKLTSLDLSGFDTSNVTYMRSMFNSCSSLTSLDLSGFDTSKVTNMSYMFTQCQALTSLDLSGFDTTNVTEMSWMFRECESLTSLDVSRFDTSNVKNMSDMFYLCSALTSLDVSGFDTSKVTNMNMMFWGCKALTTIIGLENWDTSNAAYKTQMFTNCPAPIPSWYQ